MLGADLTSDSTAPVQAEMRIVGLAGHLPLRIRPAHPLSDDALYDLCRANADLRIERTSEGEIIVMPPTGSETGRRNFNFNALFGAWVLKDGTGVGFDSSTGFVLPNGAERSPDGAWVRRDRWDALSAEQRRKLAPLCPDFVVEIRSPTDDMDELQTKMREWIANGASLGWLLDPEQRRIHVYRAGQGVEVLEDPRQVSGEPLLSGFVLQLELVW